MKQFLFCLLLFILCFPLAAKHILGGTMSYKRLGAGPNGINYEIKVYLFRDCATGNPDFDNSLTTFCIYNEPNGSLWQKIDVPMLGNPQVLPTSPYTPCIEQAFYRTVITFPATNTGYTITYERCCRNNTTSNISNPGDMGFRLSMRITPSNVINSSLELSNLFPFFGNNTSFQHTIIATDFDNDSIVYDLAPLEGGGSPDDPLPTCSTIFISPTLLYFQPPFSLQNILNSTTPLTINAQGQLNAAGIPLGNFVFGLDTREFRNGQWISASHSEFTIDILNGYVGVEDELSQIGFYISPNPATNSITLSLPEEELKGYEIFSMEGKSFLRGKETLIDIANLAKGTYLMKVETDKGIGRRFFVKD